MQMNDTGVIEPTQIWTREEWLEQTPWGAMPDSDLRRFFKEEAFIHIYSGSRNKIRDVHENHRLQ